jgi:putative RNA 2'-phosphotransferase
MSKSDLKQLSKLLSYLLRHNPNALGLAMDSQGWVAVEEILRKAQPPVTRSLIDEVVRSSEKQRFALSADGARIRANQGHSVAVDLGLAPCAPPQELFHGTGAANVAAILDAGLKPMGRQHVHLSRDTDTARSVGMRHGKPVVLNVAAARMAADGHLFYLSDNGVWLCDHVPAEYLTR